VRPVVILLLLASFACVRYKRVSIAPGNPDGVGCLQSCKLANHSDDAIVECASTCPGAVVHDDSGECPTGWRSASVDGEAEAVTGCASTTHVRWGRIAKISGVIAGAALIVTAVLLAASLSASTH
jgi:hypothetical protein